MGLESGRELRRAFPSWTTLVLSCLFVIACERDLDLPEPAGATQDEKNKNTVQGPGMGGSQADPGVDGSNQGGASGETQVRPPVLTAVAVEAIDESEDCEPFVVTLDGFNEADPEARLEVEVTQSPRLGTLSEMSGLAPLPVTYSPKPDAFGSDSFRFYVHDAEGNRSLDGEVRIELAPVNDAPRAVNDSAETDSNTPIVIDVLANDSDVDDDSDDLVVTATSKPEAGAVELVSERALRYVPTHPQSGITAFTYTIRDRAGLEASASVTVTVNLGFANPNDRDNDGLENDTELRFGTDPDDSDSDDDGIPDGIEDANQDGVVGPGETDPRLPDSDGDGRCDGLRTDNDGDKNSDSDPMDPSDDCLGPVLVDVDNSSIYQDGLSWATAFGSLQAALDLADGQREVWVAQGRYTADEPKAPVAQLPADSELYGGFVGGETYLAQRVRASRATILDGDFALDDDQDVSLNRSDNSEQVVEFLGGGRLDGFLVQNGEQRLDAHRPGAGAFVSGASVVLSNLEFSRNISHGDGGAVGCHDCELTVSDSSFEANQAMQGGAIYATAGSEPQTLLLSNVTFNHNVASGSGGAVYTGALVNLTASGVTLASNSSGDDGGALFAWGGTTTLSGVDVFDNEATGAGGGIFNLGVLYADSVSFEGNRALTGGGLHNSGDAGQGNAFLTDVTMLENSVGLDGGAFYSKDARVELRLSELSGNYAHDFGGAILQYGGQLLVEKTMLVENIADRTGGAIRSYQATSDIKDSSFIGNLAGDRGAGLEQWGGSAVLDDVKFEANHATNETTWGGGLYCQDASCSLGSTTFRSNEAYYGAGMYCYQAQCSVGSTTFVGNLTFYSGGGLYCNGSTCALDDTHFSSNTSGAFAAGVTCTSSSTCTFAGANLTSNTASQSGGGIYCQSSVCDFLATGFERNEAVSGGGIICNVEADCSFEQTNFTSNYAQSSGGGLYCGGQSTCSLEATSFAHNDAGDFLINEQGGYGGGIYCTAADCAVNAGIFLRNRAETSGAAFFHRDGNADLHRSVLLGNAAAFGGGVFEYAGALVASEVAFVDNTALAAHGGGLHTSLSLAHLRSLTFVDNRALRGGGAHHRDDPDISEYPESEIIYFGVTFAQNNASGPGGAVYATLSTRPTLTNVTLLDNLAQHGGALATEDGAHPVLTNVSLFGNRSSQDGGAIHNAAEATATVLNSVFFDNQNPTQPSDLVDLSGSQSRAEYTLSVQPLVGDSNHVTSANPFLRDGTLQVFLDQSLSGSGGVIDQGSNLLADDASYGFNATGSASWTELTTSATGSLDDNEVDLGRHYHPEAVAIVEFDVTKTHVSWTVRNAEECLLFDSISTRYQRLHEVVTGGNEHSYQKGTDVVLVCFGAAGEPGVARGKVP